MGNHTSVKSPSLTSLRVLEAVVRTGFVKRAADELTVSASAVSHQLRILEEECGAPLFRREGRRLVPLPLALKAVDEIGDAFRRLANAHTNLTSGNAERLVRVVAPTSFTLGWLFPRTQKFSKLHPKIELFLIPSDNPAATQRTPAQVVIHHGNCPNDIGWEPIMSDVRVVLGTPEVLTRVKDLNDPSNVPLIRVSTEGGSDDGLFTWEEWFANQGILPGHPIAGPYASQGHLALNMALRGEGLVLAEISLAVEHVKSGKLVMLPGSETPSNLAYWCKVHDPLRKDVPKFVNWLRHELEIT